MVKSFSLCYEPPGIHYSIISSLSSMFKKITNSKNILEAIELFRDFSKFHNFPKSLWRKVRFQECMPLLQSLWIREYFRCRGLKEHSYILPLVSYDIGIFVVTLLTWFVRIVVSCVVEYEDEKHVWYSNTGLWALKHIILMEVYFMIRKLMNIYYESTYLMVKSFSLC